MELSSKTRKTVTRQTKEEGKFHLNAKSIAQIGMLSAIAAILMLFEFPLWFAPPFYQIDLSEIPILIGGFALGPVAGILIELVKNLIKIAVNTSTGGVGEFANFVIGCAFVVPSALYYRRHKTRKGAAISMVIGTVSMTIIGSIMNAFFLLPFYATAFGLPIDALIEMGSAVNPNITSLNTFIMLAVAPFNLLKGAIVSFIAFFVYKKIRVILH